MQGLFINDNRPVSKRAVREGVIALTAPNPNSLAVPSIRVEATSFFNNEYDGPLDLAPAGRIDFVGPNPHTDRRFYGSIVVSGEPGSPDRKYVVK